MTKTILMITFGVLLASPLMAQTGDDGSTGGTPVIVQQADSDDDGAGSDSRPWEEQRAWYIHGGVSRFTAQMGENYGLGFGIEGGYVYGLRDNVLIRLTGGYYYFSADSIVNGPSGASSTLGMIPLLAGADYLFSTGGLTPYIGGSAGAVFLSADFVDPTLTKFQFANVLDGYFAAEGRLGIMMKRPDSRFEYGAMASYNMIFDELVEFNMGNPTAHHSFRITAGVTYFIETF